MMQPEKEKMLGYDLNFYHFPIFQFVCTHLFATFLFYYYFIL